MNEPERAETASGAGTDILRGRFLGVPLLSALAFVALDAACQIAVPFRKPFEFLPYAASVLFAASCWTLLWLAVQSLPRALAWPAAGLVSTGFLLTLASSFIVSRAVGNYLTRYDLAIIAGNPGLLGDYLTSYIPWPLYLPFAGAVGLTLWLWRPRHACVRPPARERLAVAAAATALAAGLSFPVRAHRIPLRAAPDACAFLAAAQASNAALFGPARSRLHPSPDRIAPAPVGGPDVPNVILLINESWGRARLKRFGHPEETMPRLRAWIDAEPDRFVAFDRAYSNAPVTDLSLPSLVTGVAPWEPNEKLHRMPLFWGWARAAGIRNCYFASPSRAEWAGVDRFLLSAPGPDRTITARDIPGVAVNDLGKDEMLGVRALESLIEGTPPGERFFAIYYSNATHYPFQGSSPRLPDMPPIPHRYDRALWIMDQVFDRIRASLGRAGRLDDTLLVFTADHGDFSERRRAVARTENAYEDVAGIPLMLRLPKRGPSADASRRERLRANARRNVSNLDVLPTVVEALGLDADPKNRALLDELPGRSLFQAVPEDRFLFVTSVNAVRGWDLSAFAILWKDFRFVSSTLEGDRLFDLAADPGETRDLLPERPDLAATFSRIVAETPNLAAQPRWPARPAP